MYTLNQRCDVCGHLHKKVKVYNDIIGKAYRCENCGRECDVLMENFDLDDRFICDEPFNPDMIYTPVHMSPDEIEDLNFTKKQAVKKMADSVIRQVKRKGLNINNRDFKDPISILSKIDILMENVRLGNYFAIAYEYADQMEKKGDPEIFDPKEEFRYSLIVEDLVNCGIMELAKRYGQEVGFRHIEF